MLTRLIYASRTTENVGIADVRAIIESAARHNVVEGVTGILCFDRVNFFQCLEGGRSSVNKIYNSIITDRRHTDVALVEYSESPRRLFGSWSMAYLSAQDDSIKSIIRNYSPNELFRPHDLSASQASNLIVDFSRALIKESNIPIMNQ